MLPSDPSNPFLGISSLIRSLEQEAQRAVRGDAPVLILGETGTGKGALARWLHRNGPRAKGLFTGLNCIGLQRESLEMELFGHPPGTSNGAGQSKPGLFEGARGGTVFLDEVGDLDPSVQQKIRTVIEEKRIRRQGEAEERQVDIRLIAATHQHLEMGMQQGSCREKSNCWIHMLHLNVPPLRKRVDDIPVLAEAFLQSLGREVGKTGLILTGEALHELRNHRWSANLRELRNVIERAVLRCRGPEVRAEDFQLGAASSEATPSYGTRLELAEIERQHLRRVLEEEGGRIVDAARRLGIPPNMLLVRLGRAAVTGT